LWKSLRRSGGQQPRDLLGVPTVSTGDRGTKKVPNIGDHALFSIMTTEPNGIVEPIHEKAMPVMLMTPDDVDHGYGACPSMMR